MLKEFNIREAELKDIQDIAIVHVDCWRTTYRGIIPDEKLDSLEYTKSEAKWENFFDPDTAEPVKKILVAEKNGSVIGFCAGGRVNNTSIRIKDYKGEIKAVYILREFQRRGLGRLFIKMFEEIFSENGIYSYLIWVLKDNASKKFYKDLGGKLIATKNYEIGGKKLKGLCFGWKI